jgi:hypothetical protein
VVRNGHVLAASEASIPRLGLVVAVGVGERVLLPREETQAGGITETCGFGGRRPDVTG